MARSKTNMILLIAIILIFAGIALGWHWFFGRPNPPLPRAQVSMNSATSTNGAQATSTDDSSSTDVNEPNPTLSMQPLAIDGAKFSVEMAVTPLQQARGLSYRTALGTDDGMLFVFPRPSTQTFWMKDMHFALDMIWIGGNTVVGIQANALAPTSGTPIWSLPIYTSPSNTDKVLEVNAGTVAKYGIKVGDTLTIGGQ